MNTPSIPKPEWIRVPVPSGDSFRQVNLILEKFRLHTVCDEAQCPNKGECWSGGTAAFMVMGDICTRACRFCAVKTAREGRPLDALEGEAIARAAAELGLTYAVLTSVDRDDLPDRGAAHFASCIAAIRTHTPDIRTEALIPDYTAEELATVLDAGPDVIAHNVETVRSLQGVRDGRASFDKSLETLRSAKILGTIAASRPQVTKSSLILGMGEKPDEVLSAMDELRAAAVDILVMGQYLRPTKKQLPVAEYITPDQFARYAEEAKRRGFSSVVSAPFARTSYHAANTFPVSNGVSIRMNNSKTHR